MMILKNKKAQSAVEYSLILILVLGAFVAVQNYMKRGLQGRWKAAVDDLGDQYDPRVADSSVRYTLIQNTDTAVLVYNVATGGRYSRRTDQTTAIETKTGNIMVGAY